jgi:hypothetical protein
MHMHVLDYVYGPLTKLHLKSSPYAQLPHYSLTAPQISSVLVTLECLYFTAVILKQKLTIAAFSFKLIFLKRMFQNVSEV